MPTKFALYDRKLQPIENVNKGEYVRLMTAKPLRYDEDAQSSSVWVMDGYNRSTRLYSLYKFDDISSFRELKKGTLVEIEFNF